MKDIERLHKVFGNEVTAASWSFFVWKGINNVASSDREVYRALNNNALSWNIITYSLQSTFFIILGRLFDRDRDAFSVDALLRACIENIGQFSKDALRERKIRETHDQHIAAAYVPSEKDFQILRGETSKKQNEYEEIYKPIRNKIIAHKEMQTIHSVIINAA